MTLHEAVALFIQHGSDLGSLRSLLRRCLAEDGAVGLAATQLLAGDMYDDITFNYDLKAPAALCLTAWGDQGLAALVQNAKGNPTTKNVGLALDILANVAVGVPGPDMAMAFLGDSDLISLIVSRATAFPHLAKAAQKHLRAFIHWFSTDEDAAGAVAMRVHFLSNLPTDQSRAISALFSALATRMLAINDRVLAEFEELLRSANDDEPRLQAFLVQHATLLDPMALEVWPQPNLHGAQTPDFVVRRTDNSYLVVEIETPGKMLMTASGQLAAEAQHAAAQVLGYRIFMLERAAEMRASFPHFAEPDGLAVVGLESALSPAQASSLARENRSRQPNVNIVGFDWLLNRARTIASNLIEGGVPSTRMRVR